VVYASGIYSLQRDAPRPVRVSDEQATLPQSSTSVASFGHIDRRTREVSAPGGSESDGADARQVTAGTADEGAKSRLTPGLQCGLIGTTGPTAVWIRQRTLAGYRVITWSRVDCSSP
jgi:hypothetical protein